MRSFWIKIALTFAITFLAYTFYRRNLAPASSNSSTTEQAPPAAQSLPADFKAFYEQFQSDSVFQMEHIAFPLYYEENGQKQELLAENWITHRPFDDMGGTFERVFEGDENIVIETIVTRGAPYHMIRRFGKLADGWNLIYYLPMGDHSGQTSEFIKDQNASQSSIEINGGR